MKSSHKLALLGTLALGIAAQPAAAQSEKPAKAAAAEGKPQKGAPGGDLEALKQAKETRKQEREQNKAQAEGATNVLDKAKKAQEVRSAKDERVEPGGKGRFQGALRQLRDEIKEGKIEKDEVKTRLMELAKNRDERRKAHRESIRERWGQKLTNPSALNEVRHHQRRMAFLNRIAVVAQTEKTGEAQEKLLERVDKLIELETARHHKAMARLQPLPAGAAVEPAAANAKGAAADEATDEAASEDSEEAEESPSGGAE